MSQHWRVHKMWVFLRSHSHKGNVSDLVLVWDLNNHSPPDMCDLKSVELGCWHVWVWVCVCSCTRCLHIVCFPPISLPCLQLWIPLQEPHPSLLSLTCFGFRNHKTKPVGTAWKHQPTCPGEDLRGPWELLRPLLSRGSGASAPQNCSGHVHGGWRITRRFGLQTTKPSGPGIFGFMV